MTKYKLEIFFVGIFGALLTGLLWNSLAVVFPQLPFVILTLCFLAIAVSMISLPKNKIAAGEVSTDVEKYAPKFYAQMMLSSFVGVSFFIALAVILNRDRFSKTFDVTMRKVNSLNEETVKYIASLDRDVEIYCVPAKSDAQMDYCEESRQLRTLYAQKSGKIRITDVNLQDPEMMRRLSASGFSRLILMTKDSRSEIVGTITESKLTNGLINLIKTKKTVYVLTGSGEPGISDEPSPSGQIRSYAQALLDLKARSFEMKQHSITAGDLPADAQLVIAGSSSIPYNSITENILRRFLAKGGKLILTTNPYRSNGLEKFVSELGLEFANNIIVNNPATQFGAQLAQSFPMRPPTLIGDFKKDSPVSVLTGDTFILADGAREIKALPENKEAVIKARVTPLMNAIQSAAVPLTEDQRNAIPLEGATGLVATSGADPKQLHPVGYQIEIENASRLSEGTGAAGTSPAANAAPVSAEVILLGFEIAGTYDKIAQGSRALIPVLVPYLYQDKELVSIPTKDFAPRAFKMTRNPESYLLLFAGFLPLATALIGFYIGIRRRSA